MVLEYQTAEESQAAGITYHLCPAEIWRSRKNAAYYTPDAYAEDGYIHCTDGLDVLIHVGNMFYTGDPREYLALALRVSDIEPEIRYDDPDHTFPHLYGPLNVTAVAGELPVHRGNDGRFIGVGSVRSGND